MSNSISHRRRYNSTNISRGSSRDVSNLAGARSRPSDPSRNSQTAKPLNGRCSTNEYVLFLRPVLHASRLFTPPDSSRRVERLSSSSFLSSLIFRLLISCLLPRDFLLHIIQRLPGAARFASSGIVTARAEFKLDYGVNLPDGLAFSSAAAHMLAVEQKVPRHSHHGRVAVVQPAGQLVQFPVGMFQSHPRRHFDHHRTAGPIAFVFDQVDVVVVVVFAR